MQGLPLMKPPYGRITAIDLNNGDIAWQIAHGETPDDIKNHPALKGLNIPRTGRPGLLGPLVHQDPGDLRRGRHPSPPRPARAARCCAPMTRRRARRKARSICPAPQTGSPMTYMLGGRQYIVLAIGGGWLYR